MSSFGPIPGADPRCEIPLQLMFPMGAAQAFATASSLQYAMPMQLPAGSHFMPHTQFGALMCPQPPFAALPAPVGQIPFPFPDSVLSTNPQPAEFDSPLNPSFPPPPISVRSSRLQQDVPVAPTQTIYPPTPGSRSRATPGVTWLSLRGHHSTLKPDAGQLV